MSDECMKGSRRRPSYYKSQGIIAIYNGHRPHGHALVRPMETTLTRMISEYRPAKRSEKLR